MPQFNAYMFAIVSDFFDEDLDAEFLGPPAEVSDEVEATKTDGDRLSEAILH